MIACAVYNVLLRDLPSVPGYAWPVWPNEVLHVWAPLLLVRGAIAGWWPYPFLNPNGVNGIMGVIVYVVGIALIIWLIAFLGLLLAKIRTRQPPSVFSTPEKVSA